MSISLKTIQMRRHGGHAATPSQKIKPLSPRQMVALQMTLDGHTKGSIQERLNISQPTLFRWRALPGWNEQVDLLLRSDSTDGEGQLKSMLPMATQALKALVLTGAPNIKLGAARTILEAHAALVAREEQHIMITSLEQQLHDLQEMAMAAQNPMALEPAIDAEVSMPHDSPHVEACAVEITE